MPKALIPVCSADGLRFSFEIFLSLPQGGRKVILVEAMFAINLRLSRLAVTKPGLRGLHCLRSCFFGLFELVEHLRALPPPEQDDISGISESPDLPISSHVPSRSYRKLTPENAWQDPDEPFRCQLGILQA